MGQGTPTVSLLLQRAAPGTFRNGLKDLSGHILDLL